MLLTLCFAISKANERFLPSRVSPSAQNPREQYDTLQSGLNFCDFFYYNFVPPRGILLSVAVELRSFLSQDHFFLRAPWTIPLNFTFIYLTLNYSSPSICPTSNSYSMCPKLIHYPPSENASSSGTFCFSDPS